MKLGISVASGRRVPPFATTESRAPEPTIRLSPQ